jgi:hypothetical protein
MFVPPNEDEKNLRLLSIFHYVVGGLNCFGGLFGLFYVGLGIFFLNASPATLNQRPGEPSPEVFGWIFIAIGTFVVLLAGTLGICTILAGRKLAKRTGYRFAFVMACIECIGFPFGTILGVFTLIVLTKPTVKSMFQPATAGNGLTPAPAGVPPIG